MSRGHNGPVDYLPLFFDLRDRICVVTGGGETAVRKCALLLRAGARVRVVAESPIETLEVWAAEDRVILDRAAPRAECFEDACLAIVADEEEEAAERAAALAHAQRIPVNVVDRPRLCTCIVPAIVDRSPVVVAISTAGAAPVLGRFLRARLEALLPARLGALAELAQGLRPEVAQRLPATRRRGFWESVLAGPVAELVFAGRDAEARARMLERLSTEASAGSAGQVYLVAVPPGGDPERLTLRGLRLLQQADLVLHDAGLSQPLLDLVRRDAERRVVGPDADTAETLDELTAMATEGRRVAWFTVAATLAAAQAAVRLESAGVHVQGAD